MCSNNDFYLARNLMARHPEYSVAFKTKVSKGKLNVKEINSEFLTKLFNEHILKHYGEKLI